MRNDFRKKVNKNESATVNLNSNKNSGTHWDCYRKRSDACIYYDSFAGSQSPDECIKYLGYKIMYNNNIDQDYDTIIC